MNPNGVGLGLSICRKICKNLHGEIECFSKLGTGTIFTYYVACDILDDVTGSVKQSSSNTPEILSSNYLGRKMAGTNLSNEADVKDLSLPTEFSHLVNRMH
jgi:hypothetical protein